MSVTEPQSAEDEDFYQAYDLSDWFSDEELADIDEGFANLFKTESNTGKYTSINSEDEDQNSKASKELKDAKQERERLQTKRSEGYTSLVESFVKYYDARCHQNKIFKAWFFYTILILFSSTFCLPFLVVFLAAIGAIGKAETIMASVTSLGSIIASVVIIPRIIAEYLFSQKEDETIIGMIKEVYQGDSQKK